MWENEIWPATSAASLIAPADMFAIGESRLFAFQPNNDSPATVMAGLDFMLWGLAQVFSFPERHGKNYNQLFCDAHVEGIPPAILFNVTNTAVRWNNDHQPHPENWPPFN